MLLGKEFMTSVGGENGTYTEMFKYCWTNPDGELRSHEILAPGHTASPPLYAYAYFGGLTNNEAELQDVQDAAC